MNERPPYRISAAAGKAEVYLYEVIGENLLGEGVTARQFVRELAALEVGSIDLHLNSPGGSVFDGQAIFNALVAHPATVTTYIDGVAASIASVVALAGERVVMARNALFMIHDPMAPAFGPAAELRKTADLLDQVAGTIRSTYAAKSGMGDEELRAAMAEETWYTASEALKAGFVDEVADTLAAAACGLRTFDLAALGYKRPPAPRIATPALPGPEESAPAPAAEAAAVPAAEAERTTDLARVGWRTVPFARRQ
jgi:ATP-dependent protease ClpP protease subunit